MIDVERFKAAVIGLGFIGAGDQVSGDAIGQNVADLDGTHASALAAHRQVSLVTGSSREEGRRRRFEQRYRVDRTYTDWRHMLAAEELDIVSVATNSPCHAEITMACAAAGVRAVLCEKPIATRLSDADRAIQSCKDHNCLLVVNHSRRWHPLWQAVRDEVQTGTIGQVRHVDIHWSTGRLGNVGTHIFDVLRMILGAEAMAVSGSLDPMVAVDCRGPQFHDPGGWGIISFTNGIKAFVHAPQQTKFPLVLRLVGDLGKLTVRGDGATVQLWSGDQRMICVTGSRGSSLDRAVQQLADCLARGGEASSTGEDGLAALEMIIGFHASHRGHGQWIELPIRDANRELEVAIG